MRYATPDEAPVNAWWLPTPDGGMLVFDALRTVSDARAAVDSLRRTHRPVRGILITHPHPDHVTGLTTFKEAFPSALIYSTPEAVAYLAGKGKELLEMNVQSFGRTEATDHIPTPDVLLRDGQSLTIGGLEIRVRSLGSGESPAATVYFIPSMDILVSGDILTPRRVPLLAAGRTAAWLEQVDALRQAYDPDTRVLPGHGPATDLGSAADWQESYIEAFRAEVTRATGATSDAGACVSAEEGERVLVTMRREHPTDAPVARLPEGVLDALNLEGVNWELTGKTCPGTANPVRERRAGSW